MDLGRRRKLLAGQNPFGGQNFRVKAGWGLLILEVQGNQWGLLLTIWIF